MAVSRQRRPDADRFDASLLPPQGNGRTRRGAILAGVAGTGLRARERECTHELTGSHSTGRNGRYPYYHCAKCGRVRTSKPDLERSYLELLERLQLQKPFLKLFRAIVTDSWTNERAQTRNLKNDIESRIEALTADISSLEQAYVFKRTIDATTYGAQLQRLRDEMTAAQCELSDARFDELEVEGVLSFAEYVLSNLSSLWIASNVADRIRLQETLFPTGLAWDGERFGTAVTNGAFSWLQGIADGESSLASPTGFEPVF